MTARQRSLDLFPKNVRVPSVTREVLERQQVDEPKVDLPEMGMCPDLIKVEPGGNGTGTRTGAFEFSDHIGNRLTVIDHKARIPGRRTAATLTLGHLAQDVLKPDPFSDGSVLE